MLTILFCLSCLLLGYFLGTYLEYTKQTLPLSRKAVALLEYQDQYITRLQEDNLTLVTIAKQQQALKNQYAQHLESDTFPSLIVTNLN